MDNPPAIPYYVCRCCKEVFIEQPDGSASRVSREEAVAVVLNGERRSDQMECSECWYKMAERYYERLIPNCSEKVVKE